MVDVAMKELMSNINSGGCVDSWMQDQVRFYPAHIFIFPVSHFFLKVYPRVPRLDGFL